MCVYVCLCVCEGNRMCSCLSARSSVNTDRQTERLLDRQDMKRGKESERETEKKNGKRKTKVSRNVKRFVVFVHTFSFSFSVRFGFSLCSSQLCSLNKATATTTTTTVATTTTAAASRGYQIENEGRLHKPSKVCYMQRKAQRNTLCCTHNTLYTN